VPLQADEAILSENYDKARTLIMAYNRYFPGDRAMEAKLDRLNQKIADLDNQRQQQERDRQQQETANRGRTLLANGIAEYKRGNYTGAVDLLEQSVKIDSQQPDAYFYLGASCLELKNFARAQEYFKRAIQLKPDYAPAHLNLGILAQTDRNWDLAITHLQRVIQLGGVPNYPVDKLQGMIRELEVRKSFGALVNRSIAVEHKHVFGGCSGYLSFTPDSIRYETNESKDGFNQPLKNVQGLSFTKGEELNFQIGEKKYRFEIKNANAFEDIRRILPEYLKILK
jgi:tetratricopeptide (TPR) repeat protein